MSVDQLQGVAILLLAGAYTFHLWVFHRGRRR